VGDYYDRPNQEVVQAVPDPPPPPDPEPDPPADADE
jgi:hypothetical protein